MISVSCIRRLNNQDNRVKSIIDEKYVLKIIQSNIMIPVLFLLTNFKQFFSILLRIILIVVL